MANTSQAKWTIICCTVHYRKYLYYVNLSDFRYETIWLPLLVKHGKTELWRLQPPDDVWWIWHVHMLAPIHYQHDCQNIVGK